jgi:type VI secretion system protein ImpH
MARAHRLAADPVSGAALETFERDAHSYTLFAALRHLEQLHPAQPRLGEARKAAEDIARIAQLPHMYFAPAEIAGCTRSERGVPVLEQLVFGVFGPNGALPLHLTEYADARARQHDDPTVKDFVNLFQHRLACLFYRAWANADPCASRDRPDADDFRLYLGALVGIGPQSARERDALVDEAKLSRVGLFGPQTRSAEALEQAVGEYFEVPAQVIPFIGEWLPIAPDSRCRLGVAREHATLGQGATLGARTWQRQFRFEIALGPLPLARFTEFLPGARALAQLRALVAFYTNEEWSWQLRLLLEPQQLPSVQLGQSGWLGWTSWLGRPAAGAARMDTIIEGSRPIAA